MEATRLFDLLPRYASLYKKNNMLAAKENGVWREYSSDEVLQDAKQLSYGLRKLGVSKNDKISVIANNRPEWIICDMGMMMAGAINVPVYPTICEHDLEFILNDAEIKIVFVSSKFLFDSVSAIKNKVKSLINIYTFDKVEGANHWSEIMELGKANQDEAALQQIQNSIGAYDLASILYTSGTTGNPKGVMLSHNNLLSNAKAGHNLVPWDPKWKAFSFLPLNHVFARMLNILYLYEGMSIYYAESTETIAANILEVKPQIFATVPRLLEKVYDRILEKGNAQTGIKKKLFFWALDLGLKYELNEANGAWYEFQLKIANKIIFNKWRDALGGNLYCIISGGAALQPRLARVFCAAGIPVLEGYGLTETSPVSAVNTLNPDSMCFGTVGPVYKDVQVKIDDDGEILIKGPNIMMGYYKQPEKTSEVIDKDGWFHTGDIGTFVQNKFLKITDRKKEMFKTSGGKYIAPQVIENLLKHSPFIEQVMVVGENEKFPAALIVPNFVILKEWCKRKNIEFTDNEKIILNEKVIERIWQEVEHANVTLSHFEMIKKIALVPREWTIDNTELTPKLSLRRKEIATNFKHLIDDMYQHNEH